MTDRRGGSKRDRDRANECGGVRAAGKKYCIYIIYLYLYNILYILNARINCNHREGLIIGKKVREREMVRGG